MPAAVNGMKECSECKATKDVSEFHKDKHQPDGLRYQCKSCSSAQKKARWADDLEFREREKARSKARRADPEYIERDKAQQRARYANDPELRERRKAYKKARLKAMPAAVYEIVNTITGKTYVGSTTMLSKRWTEHKLRLRKGVHESPALQADYDKYGKDAFEFLTIQEYPSDTPAGGRQLLEHEQQVIEEYIAERKEVYNEQTVLILEQEQEQQ